ncbi:MAG: patatin family protein [Deltaproteobacteria bacterium HGW-Deltaproteobacteria-6]|nr:MAG: patatin family protein [Deltaproteobacteria bacterium HGW-Deltaproteobacteria-6]
MNGNNIKSALIVEGGGMRGIFAAGVLHAFGNAGFDPFDLYIGVSAGACHLASHLAGQNSRNFDITLRYSLAPEFINLRRFLTGGHLMDLDWMWEQTITHYRLNLKHIDEKLRSQNKEYLIVATSMETGKALYLQPDENTLEHYLKVSSSLPILYRNILEVNGEKATDGGMANSIPVREAARRGATDITVIRSRPADYVKKGSPVALAVVSCYFRKYPRLVQKFKNRADNYNSAVAFIKNPPPGVRIQQIAPPPRLDVGRTTKDEATLRSAYETGIDYGNRFVHSHAAFAGNK